MKKSTVILALALGVSICNLNALNDTTTILKTETVETTQEISPLCKAVATGDVEVVKNFIASGADLNVKSKGMLPIHYAAKYNRVDIIKMLITAGSDVHSKCDKGYTALKHAEITKAKDAASFLKRFKKRTV